MEQALAKILRWCGFGVLVQTDKPAQDDTVDEVMGTSNDTWPATVSF
ncbi:MAG: hypothetical protein KIS88_07290 [Anaerolineales bacterium]|nr:hypothetical protein [Anaerolineales bacterium]